MKKICEICGSEIVFTDKPSGKCPLCKNIHCFNEEKSEALVLALNRAAEYRLACDFARAAEEYRLITEKYPAAPEAHFGMLLSHYEVEFIMDKERGEFIPTCHKIRNKKVFENENYLAATANASEAQRASYVAVAEEIAMAQDALKARYMPGSTLTFGRYHQQSADYKEPIEWIILARKHNRILLISKYLLDRKPYEENARRATWETSSVRRWLNSTFFCEAFSMEEQARVSVAEIITKAPRGYDDIEVGDPTNDKIFFLSTEEAHKYFPSAESKKCVPTPYAVSRGAHKDRYTGYGWWWLRTPGCSNSSASHVCCDGGVRVVGVIGAIGGAVRPAMWITLDA